MSKFRSPWLVVAAIVLVSAANGIQAFADGYDDANIARARGDFGTALQLYLQMARRGEARAQTALGLMYSTGNGVKTDFKEAFGWFSQAASRGDVVAQTNLGAMFQYGNGIPRDYLRAHMWFNLAAAKGYDSAMFNLRALEERMVPSLIAQAQEMARTCITSNYKRCPEERSTEIAPTAARPKQSGAPKPTVVASSATPMHLQGGTFVVPVLINGAITLNFVVDSGASDVSIPADVVMTLMRTGTLKETDFYGEKTYILADGSKVPSQTFRIRSLKVGDKLAENVNGSMASVKGSLLLGQSFLRRFKSWSIDNDKHALVLE